MKIRIGPAIPVTARAAKADACRLAAEKQRRRGRRPARSPRTAAPWGRRGAITFRRLAGSRVRRASRRRANARHEWESAGATRRAATARQPRRSGLRRVPVLDPLPQLFRFGAAEGADLIEPREHSPARPPDRGARPAARHNIRSRPCGSAPLQAPAGNSSSATS